MKNTLLKIAALASVSTGGLLLSQPATATNWQTCITDGGYQPTTTWSSCVLNKKVNADGSTTYTASGQCGGSRVPKGYYCANGGTGTTCDKLPDKTVNSERYEGNCQVQGSIDEQGHITNITATCTPGTWYVSSGTASVGDCKTNP